MDNKKMDQPFQEYVEVLKKAGDKFPPKYIVAKYRDAIFAALRKVQYVNCLHDLPSDVKECVEEIDVLMNEMENHKPRPAAMASAFGAPVENEPCAYCGSTKGKHSGEEIGHDSCIECGGV